MIVTYNGKTPQIAPSAFVAENATLIGDVTVEENASVWFGAVLRADNDPIVVGKGSNVQDNATVHSDAGHPTTIGKDVTVGHNAVVHGCTVHDGALIGMGSVVLDLAVIGEYSIVGAGSVVTARTEVPPYSLVLGTPGKVAKTDRFGQKDSNLKNAEAYKALKDKYKAGK